MSVGISSTLIPLLGGCRVGADEGGHVGVVGAGGPTVAVHDEVVAVEHGAGPHPGQVGPGTRSLTRAPHGELGAQDKKTILLFFGAEGQQRGGDGDSWSLGVEAIVIHSNFLCR